MKKSPWPLLCSVLFMAVVFMLGFNTIWDDAFITFRVARHWAGLGLPVYNPGIIEWVPTTLLWTALLALGNKITSVGIPLLSQWLGGVAALLTLIFMVIIDKRLACRFTALVAAGLCSISALWMAWPLSGMETTLFSGLFTIGVLLVFIYIDLEKESLLITAGLLSGSAFLTRPEVLIVVLLITIYLAVIKKSVLKLQGLLIPFFIIAGLGYLYLWLTFGSVLPSAYFVKVNGLENLIAGKDYIESLLINYRLFWLSPVFILPWLIKGDRLKTGLLVLVISAWLMMVMMVGGDFMPFHRFIAPVWPLICFYIALAIRALPDLLVQKKLLEKKFAQIVALLLLGMIALCFVYPAHKSHDKNIARSWAKEEQDRKLIGQWLKEKVGPKTVIAVRPAGIIPYYSEMKAFDLYCLTSRASVNGAAFIKQHWVGHQWVNVKWVLDRKPDIVILDEHLYEVNKWPDLLTGKGILESQWRVAPQSSQYHLVQSEIKPGRWLQYFVMDKNQ